MENQVIEFVRNDITFNIIMIIRIIGHSSKQ